MHPVILPLSDVILNLVQDLKAVASYLLFGPWLKPKGYEITRHPFIVRHSQLDWES